MGIDLRSGDAARNERLRNLILYFAWNERGGSNLGRTKINKLAFFVDFVAFARYGKSVTGCEYQANKFGPTLKGMESVLGVLQFDGLIKPKRSVFGKLERQVATTDAQLSDFSDDEIRVFDEIADRFKDKTGDEIAEIAKREFGIGDLSHGSTIPLCYSVIRPRKPTEEDVRWCIDNNLMALAESLHEPKGRAK